MLSTVMLNVVMLTVLMLNVVTLILILFYTWPRGAISLYQKAPRTHTLAYSESIGDIEQNCVIVWFPKIVHSQGRGFESRKRKLFLKSLT